MTLYPTVWSNKTIHKSYKILKITCYIKYANTIIMVIYYVSLF
jgi:hypothetical protein